LKLDEIRAVVTGAARGLGRRFALELAAAGAHVAAGDVDRAGLRQLRADADGLPGALSVAGLDVADEESAAQFFAAADAQLGGANVLINNAGILRDGLLVSGEGSAAVKLPAVQWRKVLDVNLTGPFLLARELASRMIERGTRPGVIVNISSLARSGNAGQSSYSSSKAGLDAATRTWALELAPHGIRVGGVAPGVIETPILEGISDEAMTRLRAGIPLGRIGQPGEVWLAVRFILECDFFTGRTIEVDGGAAMGV
jgi:3-oxoacyl-[acyl-carrier protein] reductase